jgi:hypothetical protein
MQWTIHVGERKSHHYFLSLWVWVSFKQVGGFPFGLPFLLDLLGLAHETCLIESLAIKSFAFA